MCGWGPGECSAAHTGIGVSAVSPLWGWQAGVRLGSYCCAWLNFLGAPEPFPECPCPLLAHRQRVVRPWACPSVRCRKPGRRDESPCAPHARHLHAEGTCEPEDRATAALRFRWPRHGARRPRRQLQADFRPDRRETHSESARQAPVVVASVWFSSLRV